MADQTAEPEVPKTTKKAAEAVAAAEAPATAVQAPETPAGTLLRYTGPAPVIVMDLGGEVLPDQTVRTLSEDLVRSLVARGDFEVDS